MSNEPVSFPPFLLDLGSSRLLRDGKPVHLRPRTWDVLCYLARRPGRLVTKDELLSAVWSDAVVSEGTLSNSIRELRAALDDDAHAPRHIETVHRRGFRFLAPVDHGPPSDATARDAVSTAADHRATVPTKERVSRTPVIVGRDAELRALLTSVAEMTRGATRVVFVSGEAGIGKSTLIDRFAALVAAEDPAALVAAKGTTAARLAVGRAVGYLHGAPPYLPVLSAIEVLATGRDASAVLAAVRAPVPDVLRQMPWLDADQPARIRAGDRDHRRDLGPRLADLFEQLASDFPLVVVLEDLHDADAPTVDFVTSLLERNPRLPLMIVVTYRPGEAMLAENGLSEAAQAVRGSSVGREVHLELLHPDDVATYLRRRSPVLSTEEMSRWVHRQSGGNPLFMVTVADTMELTGSAAADVARHVPDSLRGLLQAQLRTLDYREREILAAAAVVGAEFSSLAVAAGAGLGVEEVEDACENLVRQSRFLRATGVADWPSGNIGQSYAFRHQLYRGVLYDTLAPPRRQVMHQRIGEALEKGHAGATLEIAADLADHFVRSGDPRRAIAYLREAAQLARSRFAHREALDLLDRAVGLLAGLPDADVRDPLEFGLETDRAASAGALYGHGSALARLAAQRVEMLGERLPSSFERFFSLLVVFGYQIMRSDVVAASRVAERMTTMAEDLDMPIVRLGAASATAMAASVRGEFGLADGLFRRVLAGVPKDFRLPNFRDVLVPSQTAMLQNLCYLDRREEAESVGRDAIARADWLESDFERASARAYAAHCAALFRDREAALRWSDAAASISRQHDIEEVTWVAEILAAWASAGADLTARRQRIARGIDGLERTGNLVGKSSFLGLLAELELEAGDVDAAAATLAAARTFCETTGSHRHLAELCRQTALVEERRGRTGGRASGARAWLVEAKRIADRQGCALVLRRLREHDTGR